LAVQTHQCYAHVPNKTTRLYKFKIYDEGLMAALAYFNPSVLDIGRVYEGMDFGTRVHNFGTWLSASPAHGHLAEQSTKSTVKHLFLTPAIELSSDQAGQLEIAQNADNSTTVANEDVAMDEDQQSLGEDATSTDLPCPSLDHAILMSALSTATKLMDSMQKSEKKSMPTMRSESSLNLLSSSMTAQDQETMTQSLDEVTAPTVAATTKTNNIMWNNDEDRIRKLLHCILVVGGGLAYIPGSADALAYRIVQSAPLIMQQFGITAENSTLKIDAAHIVTIPRDMDPSLICWKGGSVAARLDSVRETCWFTQTEYEEKGIGMLRERSFFPTSF
jgi:actin-related protein